jgi:16S rRNA (cytosine967-C5)-methyltransferase
MLEGEDTLELEQKGDFVSQIDARSIIIDILTKVDMRQAFSDKLLEKEIVKLEDIDRRFVTEVVNGVLRWRLRLDWYLDQLYSGDYENLIPEVKNNLRSSVYQLVYLDKIPPYAVLYEAVEIAKAKYKQKTANLVNAILRNFLRQHRKFEFLETQLDILDKLAIKLSHPKWLIQRWIEYWGIDEVSLLCEVNNSRPRIWVRVNETETNLETLCGLLDENNIQYKKHEDFSNFLVIDNFQEFRKLDFLTKGLVSVQDVSTCLPVLIMDPQAEDLILDMCAAPGGKTGYISEKLQNAGHVFAMDRHHSRIKVLFTNMVRMRSSNCYAVTGDALSLPVKVKFDKILIDAPCSGFGVLNRRVDLKWKRTEQDIMNMKNLQLSLLEAAIPVLKEEGILAYSTCTIEPEENEKVIEIFLEKHSEFELMKLKDRIPEKYLSGASFVRTFPHKHAMDGSFAVGLRRKHG